MNANLSTTSQWLKTATKQLEAAGVGTARLDALVLLGDVIGKKRTHLLAHPEQELTHEQISTLQKLLDRRCAHEPLAYIRGKTEFYGREFIITHDVLEPRPESETMIDLLKSLVSSHQSLGQMASGDRRIQASYSDLQIIDIGTGSGALAISANLELPDSDVLAIDIDPKCLKVARQNAKIYGANIKFLQSDLLNNLPLSTYHLPLVVLANLPYVPDDFHINEAAMQEPRIAIFGGPDGLDLYRTMFRQLHGRPERPIFVFTESLPFQHAELVNIATVQNFNQIAEDDFIQVFSNS